MKLERLFLALMLVTAAAGAGYSRGPAVPPPYTWSQEETVQNCPQCLYIAAETGNMKLALDAWGMAVQFSKQDGRMDDNLFGSYLTEMTALDRSLRSETDYAAKSGNGMEAEYLARARGALREAADRFQFIVEDTAAADMSTKPVIKEVLDSQAAFQPVVRELNDWALDLMRHNQMVQSKNALLRDIKAFDSEAAKGIPSNN